MYIFHNFEMAKKLPLVNVKAQNYKNLASAWLLHTISSMCFTASNYIALQGV